MVFDDDQERPRRPACLAPFHRCLAPIIHPDVGFKSRPEIQDGEAVRVAGDDPGMAVVRPGVTSAVIGLVVAERGRASAHVAPAVHVCRRSRRPAEHVRHRRVHVEPRIRREKRIVHDRAARGDKRVGRLRDDRRDFSAARHRSATIHKYRRRQRNAARNGYGRALFKRQFRQRRAFPLQRQVAVDRIPLCRRQQVREHDHFAERLPAVHFPPLAGEGVERDGRYAVDVAGVGWKDAVDVLVVTRIIRARSRPIHF